MSDLQLYTVANQAYTIINANLLAYGCSAGQMTGLNTGKTNLNASITAWETKRAALEAETQTKLAARQATIDALSNVGATIYNNSAVTDTMLANAGYAIYDTTKTPIQPQRVVSVTVSADGSGNAFLKWSRSGNLQGVIFVIEQSADGLEFTPVAMTTKARQTIEGLTVGTPVWFRIRATKNEAWAQSSDSVQLWAPGDGVQLQVAA